MTIEEKAKAYDNVVNKLRRFMEHGIDPLITRTDVQDFFPELAESEDEKIRKAIITFFESEDDNTTYALVQKKDILAWLEKQGKPKWSEEDKEQCDLLIEQLATLKRTLALDFRNEIKWLESLKQRMEE